MNEELRAPVEGADFEQAGAGSPAPTMPGFTMVPHQPSPATGQPTSVQIMQLQAAYEDARKSKGIMWVLWLFFGGLGGHRYYLRSYGYALAMTFTLGGFGFWALIDAFLMGRRLERVNAEIRRDLYGRHGVLTH